jgi:hypothetical protein
MGLSNGQLALDKKGRPLLGEFWDWQQQMLKPYRKLSYRKLCALPAETEIHGPYDHPDIKYFVRRELYAEGADLTPIGTVVVSVCVVLYENGKFKMSSCPSVEKAPSGKVLDVGR